SITVIVRLEVMVLEPHHWWWLELAAAIFLSSDKRNSKVYVAHWPSLDKIVLVSSEDYARFIQYQKSSSVTTFVESSKACLITPSNKWVIDSVAKNHMTGNLNTFSNFQPHNAPSPIIVADGSACTSVGSGTIKPTSSITPSSVLSLPKLAFNLIYVSKIMRDLNCYISFFPDYCMFRDIGTNQEPRSVACSGVLSPFKAHCRLRHPSLPLLKKLFSPIPCTAQNIIKYSGGQPLYLVTLGSHSQGRSVEEWRYEFKKLREIPHCDIQKILKISFDGLDCDTHSVFLDICNYNLNPKELSPKGLSLFGDACLVQDMGREIVHMESTRGKRSRLFKPQEVRVVVQGNKYCRSLKKLDLSYCKHLRSTPNFKGSRSFETFVLQNCLSLKEIHPSIGKLDRLTGRSLYCCKKITDLPSSTCQLKSLEYLNISYCSSLQTLPVDIGDLSGNNFLYVLFDFSKLPLLMSLCLNDCENLQTLPSISNLEYLEILELRNCEKLVKITVLDNLPSIQKIDMINCTSMQIPFDEGFFSAPALSIPSRKYPEYEGLQIDVQSNEILD
ncbi:hypothetical protein KY289_036470, partial [Solanum tuberosum]